MKTVGRVYIFSFKVIKDKFMKLAIVLVLTFLTACTTDRIKEANTLRPVALENKSKCLFVALITEDASGRGSVGNNSTSAMNLALNKVVESGGDSYFYVSSNATFAGSTVILESYKCK
jgi:hypothetical protein